MPGIIAVIGKRRNDVSCKAVADDITDRVYESQSFRRTSADYTSEASIRILHRKKDDYGLSDSERFIIAWCGRPMYKGRLLTEDTADEMLKSGEDAADSIRGLTGHYQLLIYYKARGECFAAADKISTHPLYYTETPDFTVITPEVLSLKALKRCGWQPTIGTGAVFQFIASGFLWGDTTFWEEVKRLAPGHFIKCGENAVELHSYWEMTFKPERGNRRFFINELSEAIDADLESIPAGKAILTLSGGYDSRGLLGLMKVRGVEFDAVSYAFGFDFTTDSDAGVGKYFADKLRVRHRFYKGEFGEPSVVIDNIRKAVVATGGETDVVASQEALLGADFYRLLAEEYDYLVRGDEIWGWSDHIVNRDMAFWECSLLSLNEFPQPAKYLKPDSYQRALEFAGEQRKSLAEEYNQPGANLDDFKDFVYWRHREPRLLQNIAYFRRCYITHIAPFLFDRTLSVINRAPSKFRVNKNLYLDLMRSRFPELFLDGNLPNPYGPKVDKFQLLYQYEAIRDFIADCLIVNPPLHISDIFDPVRFEPWVRQTLNVKPKTSASGSNIKPNPVRQFAGKALNRTKFLRSRVKWAMVRNGKRETPAWPNDHSHLFRLGILALALREYEDY
ncbi:MAG: hypothetical protein HQ591_10825 [candidate division Zixibacteria bacterium]|nr:hypothetical protein [Candidatus Tariuqbacter arcticus]